MFEMLFKYPPELFQRGELVFAPVQSWLDGAALAAVALVLLGVSLLLPAPIRHLRPLRRLTLGILQGAFMVGALVLLTRPAVQVDTMAPGANTVALLVDTSESMGFPGAAGQASRIEAATVLVEQHLLPALGRSADVATFTFGSGARRQALHGLEAVEPRTRLVDAIGDVLDSFHGTPLAAVVVVSDGADNGSRGQALARLAGAGVPVHTLGLGPRALAGDVEVVGVTVPADAPPDSRVVAEVVLQHATEGPAEVKVFDGTRLLAVRAVELTADRPTQRVAVAFGSGPGGIRELGFAVVPPPGDPVAGNNRLDRLLTVSERRRRALYLEGAPRWEYKFLRRALAGDDVVRLTSWLRTTERKTYRQDVERAEQLAAGFPDSRAALFAYDVVILGSIGAAYFTDEQHRWLEAFVSERGGSLLALAGRDALADGGWDLKPLGGALPMRLERRDGPGYRVAEARVRPTPQGLRSPIVALMDGEGGDPWTSLPPLGDYQRTGPLKPAATVLLEALVEGRPQPLLVTQPYGLGTAALLASATTWRWRMRTPPDDERHTLFWRQLLRQLGEAAQQRRDLRLQVQDRTLEVALVERDQHFRPRAGIHATATLTGPGMTGQRLTLAPAESDGLFRARYQAPESGVYRLDVAVADDSVTRFVRLGEQQPEHFAAALNEPLLRRIAATTGGRFWWPEEAAAIAPALTFASSGVKRTERFRVWDMPAAFLLLLLLKSGEWLLRRRWGRI